MAIDETHRDWKYPVNLSARLLSIIKHGGTPKGQQKLQTKESFHKTKQIRPNQRGRRQGTACHHNSFTIYMKSKTNVLA